MSTQFYPEWRASKIVLDVLALLPRSARGSGLRHAARMTVHAAASASHRASAPQVACGSGGLADQVLLRARRAVRAAPSKYAAAQPLRAAARQPRPPRKTREVDTPQNRAFFCVLCRLWVPMALDVSMSCVSKMRPYFGNRVIAGHCVLPGGIALYCHLADVPTVPMHICHCVGFRMPA
jgi:hypothetical protein